MDEMVRLRGQGEREWNGTREKVITTVPEILCWFQLGQQVDKEGILIIASREVLAGPKTEAPYIFTFLFNSLALENTVRSKEMGWASRVCKKKQEAERYFSRLRCPPDFSAEGQKSGCPPDYSAEGQKSICGSQSCGTGLLREGWQQNPRQPLSTSVSSLLRVFPPMRGGKDLIAPCKQGRDLSHHIDT